MLSRGEDVGHLDPIGLGHHIVLGVQLLEKAEPFHRVHIPGQDTGPEAVDLRLEGGHIHVDAFPEQAQRIDLVLGKLKLALILQGQCDVLTQTGAYSVQP
jgi:hypothetical protein